MEEQPWIWNDYKLAGELRSKFHSILGVADEDNDNMADEPAQAPKSASNFREEQQHRAMAEESPATNNVENDYIYDVEGRPLTGDTGRLQFYAKPSEKKRSQQLSGRRRQQQLQQGAAKSSSSSTTADETSSNSAPSVGIVRDVEPRVLPLLGFHAAVNKINRPKEALLKKILRQAG